MTDSAPRTPDGGDGTWAVIRVRIAVALVLLYAVASGAAWISLAATAPGRPAPDEISTYESRFQQLRSALPARGVVGYLGHPDPTGSTPGEQNAASLLHFKRHLLAQYALAPVLLLEGIEPEFVVGNFDPGTVPSTPAGFRIVRDFGDGLVLFRRAP